MYSALRRPSLIRSAVNLEPAVRFKNVSKRFFYSEQKSQSFLESLISLISFRKKRSLSRDDASLWALRNVSFDVMPGQGFGIIGRNGGGKVRL